MVDRRPSSFDTADLVGDLVATLGRILRGELALARAEMMRALRGAAVGLAMVVVAVILGVTAIQLFAGAGVAGLVHLGLRPWQAALVLGVVLVLVAAVLTMVGLRRLRPDNMVPQRAFAGLRRDADILRAKGNPDAA